MLRLRTLGGLSIDEAQDSLSGAALQRRRLALLAVVAAAGSQGISRDKLIGFFWPEVDEERARHALAQALYALRRALRVDELFLGAQDLRLNPAVLGVDHWEFEQALAAGEFKRAVDAYGGPFLDGVFLDDASGFEQWVEAERERLAQSLMRALESLASAADAAGDAMAAVGWWRRLAAVDPLAMRPALGLMRALAASGDSAAALRHARVYEEMLRAELDVAVAPEVVEFVRQLRETPPPVVRAGRALDSTASDAESGFVRSHVGISEAPAHRRSRSLLALSASAVIVLGLAGAATIGSLTGTEIDAPRLDSNRVAVLPFRVSGDSASYLREGMVDLLGAALDGAGSLRVVDARALLSRVARGRESATDPTDAARIAADFRAGLFVLGNVTDVGGRVQVTASLYKATEPGEPVVRSSTSAERDSIFGIVDRVAAALLAGRSTTPSQRLARVAAITTTSLPALKEYLTAEQKMRARLHGEAIEHLKTAVALDSTFALAYYRLSIASDWAAPPPPKGQPDPKLAAAESAARYAHRLSQRDRMLVDAMLAWRRNDIDEAERQYKLILSNYPDDVETWYQLGEVYFHNNPPRGRSFAEARLPFEGALAIEPDNNDARVHLMRIAAWERRWDDVSALLRRVDPKEHDPGLGPYRALARNDEAAVERAVAALGTWDAHGIVVAAGRLAVHSRRLDVAVRTATLATEVTRPSHERALAFRALANLSAARGRWREARTHVDSLRAVSPHFGLEAQARLATVPFAPYSPGEIAAMRDTLLQWRDIPVRSVLRPQFGTGRFAAEEYSTRLAAAAGLLAARLGDAAAVRSAALAIERDKTPGPATWVTWRRDRAAALRAELLRAEGRRTDAISTLLPIHAPDDWGSRDEERLLIALLLRDAGQLSEAVRWFGTFEHMTQESLPWAAPARFIRAELLERLGRRDEAAADYERVVELWRNCDQELRPMLESARSRATRLRRLGG